MGKIKTLAQLKSIKDGGNAILYWLEKNNPDLLEKYLPKIKFQYSLEDCKKEALKYETRGDWHNNHNATYSKALKNKWLDECTSHMRKVQNIYSLEDCKFEALNFKTRTEWARNSKGQYQKARKNKWLDECCSHMPAIKNKLTLDFCKKEALKYKSRNEWCKVADGTYKKAREMNWLDECCSHMPQHARHKYVKNTKTGVVYPNIAAAALDIGVHKSSLGKAIGYKKSCNGLVFVFCDRKGRSL